MYLQSLKLQHFRNHAQRTLVFKEPTTVIVGPNARGKTSIIEAVNLLATGESFRAETVPEMISLGAELSKINGTVIEDKPASEIASKVASDDKTELELTLTKGEVQGKKTALRLYAVNGVRRRKVDFTRHLTTVVFRPEDMRLIEGSPSRRREFLDAPLSLMDPEYHRSHTTYHQALTRRNKLLQQVRDGEQPQNILTYWNLTLVKHGEYLHQARRDFLEFCQSVLFPLQFTVEYDPSPISAERLAEYQPREIAAGHTLIGPHKDDVIVKLSLEDLQQATLGEAIPSEWDWQTILQRSQKPQEKIETLPVSAYGSRGQQRLAVLWLKLCEYTFLKTKKGQPPLLLLDDILSELDHLSRQRVLELIGQGQTLLTTTEPKVVAEVSELVPHSQVIEL